MDLNMYFTEKKNNEVIWICVCVIFIFALIFCFYYLMQKYRNETFENNCGNDCSVKKYSKKYLDRRKIKLHYSPHCGYCTEFLPEWEKFNNYVLDNNLDIHVEKINCDKNMNLCQGIQGFPTVLLYKRNGDIIKMENYPRTREGLLDFIKANQ